MGPEISLQVDVSRATNGVADSHSLKLLQQAHDTVVHESEDLNPEELRSQLRRSTHVKAKLQTEITELEAEKSVLRSRLAAQEKELERLDICLAEQEQRNNDFSGAWGTSDASNDDQFQLAIVVSNQVIQIQKLQREKAELQRSFESFALSEASERSEVALDAEAVKDDNESIKEQIRNLSKENDKLREVGMQIQTLEHELAEKDNELSWMTKKHKTLEGQYSVLSASLKESRSLAEARLAVLREHKANVAKLEDKNRKLEEEKCAWRASSKNCILQKGGEENPAVELDSNYLRSPITELRDTNTKQLTTINSLRMKIHQLEEGKRKLCNAPATQKNDIDAQGQVAKLEAKLNVVEREKQTWEKNFMVLEAKVLNRQGGVASGSADVNANVQELQIEIKDLRSEIKSAREDRDWYRKEYIRLRDEQKVTKTSAQSPTSDPDDLPRLQTELNSLKRRVARALTEFDLSLGPEGIWRCSHDKGFNNVSTRFVRPTAGAREKARAIIIVSLKHDEVFLSEYRKQRAFHVEHARAHDNAGHGTVARSKYLEQMFAEIDREYGI